MAIFPPSFLPRSFPNLLVYGQGFPPESFSFLFVPCTCKGMLSGCWEIHPHFHLFLYTKTFQCSHEVVSRIILCAPTAGDLFLVCSFSGRTKTAAGAQGDFPDCSVITPVVGSCVCLTWMRSLPHDVPI